MTSRLITPGIKDFPQFLKAIESKWKVKVARRFDRDRYVAQKDASNHKSSRYILSMFPYPSGRLHLGHVRIYTSGDLLARYSKLVAKNDRYEADYSHVINPMGFDSFGLPAENAARERGLNPAVWTNSNIRTMKQQLDDLAIQFDWREATSNPSFYKWTQLIFLKLMNAGLVYKSFAQVNWDPVDKTVLADEQVDEEGRSWRSGALVEKRYYRQWFVKVNAFTSAIYDSEEVNPETWRDVVTIQRGWIGKPCGWMFYLPFGKSSERLTNILPVFTKNPELFMARDSELLISSDHWLTKVLGLSESGTMKNPFNGGDMKISVTDDLDGLPPNTKATLVYKQSQSDDSQILRSHVLMQAKLNNYGGYYTSDKYRDWLVSRQRFWGTPIPAAHCKDCGFFGVAEDSLPVTLPSVTKLTERVGSQPDENEDEFYVKPPIEEIASDDWIETTCPSCGSKAKRECETFDTLFDSSWYFLRYSSDPTSDKPFDSDRVQPVWSYIGGKEHATMHLFYARFITHFLHSIGMLEFREPFKSLLVQGVVKSRTYKLDGKYISKAEADLVANKKKLVVEYEKMSKSKGNGVDPQDLIDTYGVDATRLCLMSYANPRSERLWRTNEEEFRDTLGFLRKVTLTVQEYFDVGQMLMSKGAENKIKIKELDKDQLRDRQYTISNSRNNLSIYVMFNIQESNQFRQYISALQEFTSTLRTSVKTSAVYTKEFAEALAALIVMLNPVVPHFSEELWSHFSRSIINPLRVESSSPYNVSLQVSDQPWPIPDHDHGRSRCHKPPQAQQSVNKE